MIDRIKLQISLFFFKRKWKKTNKDNSTYALNLFDIKKVHVGKETYGGLKVFNDTNSSLYIGSYCSIAENVVFLLGHEHHISRISTYPFKQKLELTHERDAFSKGNIVVNDDVWIGYGATIMSGVQIGQGAVIASGAIVTKNVPPYAIVGGVPAKIIKYRFEPNLIEELLRVDYSKLSREIIEEHVDDLYQDLKSTSQLQWMPKKGDITNDNGK